MTQAVHTELRYPARTQMKAVDIGGIKHATQSSRPNGIWRQKYMNPA